MSKKYKILLSAYACNPFKGSEPGIGWNWAVEVAKRGHQVYVFTRLNNKKHIEQFFLENEKNENIEFIYHDLVPALLKFKKVMGVYLYYELWQLTLLSKAKFYHHKFNFDFVHHITFGVFRQPSYLFKLGLPFFIGPVGGGEHIKKSILMNLKMNEISIEYFRSLVNFISILRPSVYNMFNKSALIFCKTEETREVLYSSVQSKTYISNDIGQDVANQLLTTRRLKNKVRILYAGRLIYWKGIDLVLEAIKKLNFKFSNFEIVFIGVGNKKETILNFAKNNNLEDKIILKGNLTHLETQVNFNESDIFLFPTLHDSSGTVIYEALKFSLPTVSVDSAGPLFILGNDCPTLIKTEGLVYKQIIEELSDILFRLCTEDSFYSSASEWSSKKIQTLSWTIIVDRTYSKIENYMDTYDKN